MFHFYVAFFDPNRFDDDDDDDDVCVWGGGVTEI